MELTPPPAEVWHWQATPPGPSQMQRNHGADVEQVRVAVVPAGTIVPVAGAPPVIVRRPVANRTPINSSDTLNHAWHTMTSLGAAHAYKCYLLRRFPNVLCLFGLGDWGMCEAACIRSAQQQPVSQTGKIRNGSLSACLTFPSFTCYSMFSTLLESKFGSRVVNFLPSL